MFFEALIDTHTTQFKRYKSEHDGSKQEDLFWSIFFFLVCLKQYFFMWTAMNLVFMVERTCWWLFVCLVLALADGKRHEYSCDANIFLRVNHITWTANFYQCPSSLHPESYSLPCICILLRTLLAISWCTVAKIMKNTIK